MSIQTASITIATNRLTEVRKFYEQHFNAQASFDCGWYVVLKLADGSDAPEICLMEPRHGMQEFSGGATLNLRVFDVDETYRRLIDGGLKITTALEDHPWGDRGFGVTDPCGLAVYCYHDIEPSEEFSAFFVKAK